MLISNGTVFCEDGTLRVLDVKTRNGRISQLGARLDGHGEKVLDARGGYVIPGLVDIHIHGAAGGDFSDGTEASLQKMAGYLFSQGVTSFLGTSMSLPGEQLSRICKAARPRIGQVEPGAATLRGVHLEGPFLNPCKCGAQDPACLVPPDPDLFFRLREDCGGKIRLVTLAPEQPGGLDFVGKASPLCTVSLGHSCADYETARLAFARGASHVTHTFNGMTPFHHRDPGIVGAAADAGAYAELICDGVHLHPSAVRAAFRLFGEDRICLVSDAMRACGMPEGVYDLGGQTVTVARGRATLEDGTLAGGITPLTDCLRRAVEFGISLAAALKAVTRNPARSVGLEQEIGVLARGREADLVILNQDLSLRGVISREQVF